MSGNNFLLNLSLVLAGVLAVSTFACSTGNSQNTTKTTDQNPNKDMKFELPQLPYATDALEPVMGKETVELHYGKHYAGYLNTLNELIKGTDFENKSLVEIVKSSEGKLFNQAGQSLNHYLFFLQMAPQSEAKQKPEGKLAEAIDKTFGSFEKFQEQFQTEAASVFGSGWCFLACDKDGKLVITKTQNADNPVTKNQEPLLAIDVWEHSYYLDYRNVRMDYLKNIWKITDWKVVEQRYNECAK